ncbi:hypothetical protein RF11_08091 [Thelohanellus kitauei]|uniref:Uncharacterized protein n=1 Tax=Thelohanellus kitauei TaxID=669202 RepID=A0A0C2JHN5_THEKT|nr:hypothetical protein RF11_08091 [Thelohanellus kitauei]
MWKNAYDFVPIKARSSYIELLQPLSWVNSIVVGDSAVSGAPEDVSNTLSLMSTKPDFGPYFRISSNSFELPTKTALKPELLQLQGSKDQCGHPSTSEESRRVSMYPEGKRAFKILSGACDLVWLARASGLFTLAALRMTLLKSLLLRDWPSPGE